MAASRCSTSAWPRRCRPTSATSRARHQDASFDFDFFLQYHIHPEVDADKPGGDPIGDWDADGGILNVGFTITARF